MASHATQIERDDPDKKGYPGPPSWGGWVWDLQPRPIKICSVEELLKLKMRLRSTKDGNDRR